MWTGKGTNDQTLRDVVDCTATTIGAYYGRLAAKEYSDLSRIGYQYFGDQQTAAFVQWPSMQFCSNTYDPRLRPWYSAAATGPKDVVIVIDVSGSMSNNGRIQMARDALKALCGDW